MAGHAPPCRYAGKKLSTPLLRWLNVGCLATLLVACGGGPSSGGATSGVATLESSTATVTVQANVTDYSASQLVDLTIANAQPGEVLYGEGRNGLAIHAGSASQDQILLITGPFVSQ
jgi:hypothetical protein